MAVFGNIVFQNCVLVKAKSVVYIQVLYKPFVCANSMVYAKHEVQHFVARHLHLILLDSITQIVQDQTNFKAQSRIHNQSDPETCVKNFSFCCHAINSDRKCSNPPRIALQYNTIKYLAQLASILPYMVLGILII